MSKISLTHRVTIILKISGRSENKKMFAYKSSMTEHVFFSSFTTNTLLSAGGDISGKQYKKKLAEATWKLGEKPRIPRRRY